MGYVFRSSRDRFWRFWINYTAHSTRDEEMREHQNGRYERQRKFWGELLRDGISAGEVDPDIDPERAANELLLMAHGLVVHQLQSPTPASREEARKILSDRFALLAAKGTRPAKARAQGR
jgi:hypothetical protein